MNPLDDDRAEEPRENKERTETPQAPASIKLSVNGRLVDVAWNDLLNPQKWLGETSPAKNDSLG